MSSMPRLEDRKGVKTTQAKEGKKVKALNHVRATTKNEASLESRQWQQGCSYAMCSHVIASLVSYG